MHPQPEGNNAPKKRRKKRKETAPFIGPILPPAKPKKTRSRITGRSSFRDERSGQRIHNSWDIEDKGDELKTAIGGNDGEPLDKFSVTSKEKAVLDHHREIQRQAARAAYWERRVFNAVPIPKMTGRKAKPKPKAPTTCPECEGSGKVWFGDYKETCIRCNGTGTL